MHGRGMEGPSGRPWLSSTYVYTGEPTEMTHSFFRKTAHFVLVCEDLDKSKFLLQSHTDLFTM
jgi:hypothetical protein